MEVLKGGVDRFSYFSVIFSYFIFLPESFLSFIEKEMEKRLSAASIL